MNRVVKELKKYKSLHEIHKLYYDNIGVAFLDSSMVNDLGKYSILGIDPYLTVKEIEGKLYINDVVSEEKFEIFLENYLKEKYQENNTGLPIIRGGIGYLSYEYGKKFEKIKSENIPTARVWDAVFYFYKHFIIEDRHLKKIYIIGDAIEEIENIEKEIEAIRIFKNDIDKSGFLSDNYIGQKGCIKENSVSAKGFDNKYIEDIVEKEKYIEKIRKLQEYIKEGHVYVANLTKTFVIKSNKKPYSVFCDLRRNNPSPFGAYINYGDFQIISSSPERFINIEDNKIETRPIKGTRKRGNNQEEDDILIEELKNSEKEKSELVMVVDLERNDLNHICNRAGVEVTDLFKIETYATVHHLVAEIKGRLKDNWRFDEVMEAVFPGGSITGTPKIRAMEIIEELEDAQRGIYTGSIGYIGFDRKIDLNIVIRTAVHQEGKYFIGSGGGITYDSDGEFEYEEVLQKASAIIEAVKE